MRTNRNTPDALGYDALDMLQDDGVTVYTCSGLHCGYKGETYCQNCGFDKDGQ